MSKTAHNFRYTRYPSYQWSDSQPTPLLTEEERVWHEEFWTEMATNHILYVLVHSAACGAAAWFVPSYSSSGILRFSH